MRARNGATAGSLDPVREGADKSVDDLCALVTPIRANDRRRVWRALEHSAKVERLGGVQRRHLRGSVPRVDQVGSDASVFRNGRLLSSLARRSLPALTNDTPRVLEVWALDNLHCRGGSL
jgi:hypothetical protein